MQRGPTVADRATAPTEVAPASRLLALINGYMVTQAVGAVAELGIADLLAAGTRSVDDLAATVGVDRDALHRLLRALASCGVFVGDLDGGFALTEVGELLRSDLDGSLSPYACMMAGAHYRTWAHVLDSVRSGVPAFERIHGKEYFEWLSDEPAEAEQFERAMAGTAAYRAPVLLDYAWSAVTTVVDVGGGNGALLTALLTRFPTLRGILFELSDALNDALRRFARAGISDRTLALRGDFFDTVPPSADRYVLAYVLHDWDDADAVRILRSCRRAMPAHGRLLILEHVVPTGNAPHPAKLLDLHMLVMVGGRERTERQWRELLAAADFALSAIKASDRACLIEAWPIDRHE
jgi:O-methyltransferase domain/Dimerisation domain